MVEGPQQRIWQGFADLALGLMAVLALVLVMLLWREGRTNATLLAKTRQLELERAAFALELVRVVGSTQQIVEDQNDAEGWVRGLFSSQDGCLLELATGDVLRRRAAQAGAADDAEASSDDFYALGETRLHARGQEALSSCCGSFLRLAFCLSPSTEATTGRADAGPGANGGDGVMPELSLAVRRELCLAGAGVNDRRAAELLGRGIEALVLEGNTDREALKWNTARDKELHIPGLSHHPEDERRRFVDNAWLGAERARQALGYLLTLPDHAACMGSLLEAAGATGSEGKPGASEKAASTRTPEQEYAMQVLMGRVRVETPSFGRYQAGPPEWREPDCRSGPSCPAARNLSLKLRWRKAELRRPFLDVRRRICELLEDQRSSMFKGLASARQLPPGELKALLDKARLISPQEPEALPGSIGQPDPLDLRVDEVWRRLGCDEDGGGGTPARKATN